MSETREIGANLRRSSPLELLARGEVTAALNTVRIWQRRLDAGKLEWPLSRALDNRVWERTWSWTLSASSPAC
eukprot:1002665-Amphidinium_carterae.1